MQNRKKTVPSRFSAETGEEQRLALVWKHFIHFESTSLYWAVCCWKFTF